MKKEKIIVVPTDENDCWVKFEEVKTYNIPKKVLQSLKFDKGFLDSFVIYRHLSPYICRFKGIPLDKVKFGKISFFPKREEETTTSIQERKIYYGWNLRLDSPFCSTLDLLLPSLSAAMEQWEQQKVDESITEN